MERLTNKQNRRIEHYMHTTSRMIVDRLVKEGIGTLVIGKNDGWKQEVELGKRKVAPEAFEREGVVDGKGIGGVGVGVSLVVHPVRIIVPRRNQKKKSLAR
ncbi:MAG: hypothetical protein E6J34_14255 [Chloroflexi bacterium]|nr:MAG: hypothetical protein E6J34_14255 [Chloroflexota bacterium]